ncbi:MAG: hypothetical protein ACI8Y6_001943, partial [Brevundimonas sp.]
FLELKLRPHGPTRLVRPPTTPLDDHVRMYMAPPHSRCPPDTSRFLVI